MSDFEVARAVGKCFVSGREIAPGESFYTVLLETPQGFERRDYTIESWTAPPEGSFCHFKTRLPTKDHKKKTFVDDEVLIAFFHRLAASEEPIKQRFRFVLSLILLRKRLLKYERTIREGAAEFWEMRLMRDKSVHRVFNPLLDDAQIAELTSQLGVILAGESPALLDLDTTIDAPDSHTGQEFTSMAQVES
jgi:hypothetical protein